MYHDKNTSINQASSSALNSLGKRERQPLQPRLCVPQNLELYDHKHRKHGGEHSSCARRSYDAPGMTPTLEVMRLKPQDLGGWLAGPAQPDPETRGAGWHPRAF